MLGPESQPLADARGTQLPAADEAVDRLPRNAEQYCDFVDGKEPSSGVSTLDRVTHHVPIVAPRRAVSGKGDRRVVFAWTRRKESLDARDKRVRERIRSQDAPDVLREAREAMFDYSVRERDGLLGSMDVENVARVLLGAAQSSLVKHGVGAVLEPADAFRIFGGRCWALRALRLGFSVSRAKELELEVAGGAPLTICMGRPAYFTSPDVYLVALPTQLAYRFGSTEVGIPLFGCLRVVEESTNTGSGKHWRSWCPDCVSSRAQLRRAAARMHVRRLQVARR